jgi:hypothetical protein
VVIIRTIMYKMDSVVIVGGGGGERERQNEFRKSLATLFLIFV